MLRARQRQAGSEHFTTLESAQLNSEDAREWLSGLKSYTRRWIEVHKDGGVDHWTVAASAAPTPIAMRVRDRVLAEDRQELV